VSDLGLLGQDKTVPVSHRTGGFVVGCQAWCFHRYTAFEAIEKTAQAGGKVIEFFPGQKVSGETGDAKVGPGMPADALTALRAKLEKHGVRAVAFGVTGFGKDPAGNRPTFEFAKSLGILTITCEPDPAALEGLDKLVAEYDIQVAIHNHPRKANDPNYKYWDPEYVLSLVKDRDRRIGACADTGHWVRSGIKPVDAIKLLKGRVLSSHLKDLDTFTPGGKDVPFGSGVSDIPGILKEFRARKFDGVISVEYENNWESSVPEIGQCIGFVRGWGVK
jgi:sugar phosphate isomerase/epimerase